MPKRLVNGINVHHWQSGEGPDLVMIHGLNGNLAVWHLELMPKLTRLAAFYSALRTGFFAK
jgi:pimeloyl-ACP methyl ester carboxylesterase